MIGIQATPALARPSASLSAELGLLFAMAWPVAIGQLASVSMYLTDNIMVGHTTPVQMAGVATGGWWFYSVYVPMLGVLRVLDPMVSQAIGAGDEHGAARSLARGAVLAGVLSVLTAGCMALTGPMLTLLGQPAEAIPVATAFARNLVPGIPGAFGFFLLRGWLQARGEMRSGNIAIVLANGLNLFLDWVFIYGHLGVPALGGAGAGIATSIGNWFQFGVIGVLSFQIWRPALGHLADALRPESWSRLLPLGLPLGLQSGTEIWAFSLAGYMAGWVGSEGLGAHLIALSLSSVSFNVALGLGTAAATRVGLLVGAGQRIGRAAFAAHLWVWGAMALFAALFSGFPEQLAGVYSDDAETIGIALSLLPIAAAFQLFDGTQAVAFGVLRGAGDVRFPTVINLLGFWVIGLPLGGWLLHIGYGVPGVWIGLAVALGLVSTMLMARVRWVVRMGGFRV
ncbi:MAG: MATE family efflux transporter [Myxococcales bacterium]|nr:MATE family efflux transporter [Myxococcales bacterium]